MARLLLRDEEWNLIADLFADCEERTGPGRPPRDPREVLDGILWILRTGAPWRDLPEEFGSWKTAWRLFDQWNAEGRLVQILQRLQAAFVQASAIDPELWCIDGTIVRAARCAAGGGKKTTQTNLPTTL